jgi:hypothetical protein
VVDDPASKVIDPVDGELNAGELASPNGGGPFPPRMDPGVAGTPRHALNAWLAWALAADVFPELVEPVLVPDLAFDVVPRNPLNGPVAEASTVHPAGTSA